MLDFCDISFDELIEIVDSWRSEHIWGKNDKGEYYLRNPIWENN